MLSVAVCGSVKYAEIALCPGFEYPLLNHVEPAFTVILILKVDAVTGTNESKTKK